MIDLNNHKLELNYPCSWCYKIILTQECNVKDITKEIFQQQKHKITSSKVSSKGKFKSYDIQTTVTSDEHREKYHSLLKNHNNIKMVL
jgi:putative lipoic acid-binding regulatory protein